MNIRTIVSTAICTFLLITCSACGGGNISKIDGMTGEEIIAKAIIASSKIETCKAHTTVKDESMGTSLSFNGHLAIDRNTKEMSIGYENLSSMFFMQGWLYTEVPLSGWVKMKLDQKAWEQNDWIAQLILLLEKHYEVVILGTEYVNGTESYMIDIIPDLYALFNFSTQSGSIEVPETDIDPNDFIDECTLRVWIAKGSFYLTKINMRLVGGASRDKVSLTGVITLYDINEPVSIDLPYEAQDAVELNTSSWDSY